MCRILQRCRRMRQKWKKISQNVPKSIFIEKLDDVFQKKLEFFNIDKDSKIVVGCDFSANITISQNVHFFPKKWWLFFKKRNNFEIGKSSSFAIECDRNIKSSRNVQKLVFIKKIRWVFPEKNMKFWKSLKIAKLSQNATEFLKLLRTFIFFLKRMMDFLKKWKSSKSIKVANLS